MGTDELVFVLVVGSRLLVPLLVFRFPLPAVLAALVIDAADQTIFQQLTEFDLANYQSYDKALDIYYLALAYLSTLRNWAHPFHANVAAFLWYYRLVGVLLFELTDQRWMLLVFPNTFEYVFICYEAVRIAWNPAVRIGHRGMIVLTAAVWVFVKLPQEWWIHVAQNDFTDFLREDVLGVDADASWATALGDNLWFVAGLAIVAVAATFGTRAGLRAAPTPDWSPNVDVDAHPVPRPDLRSLPPDRFWDLDLVEKVVLVALITVIFAQVLVHDASPLQTAVAVAVIVVANAGVTQWLAKRGHSWTTTASLFVAMLVVNIGVVIAYLAVLASGDRRANRAATVFFIFLLTLIVTCYDRYRPIRKSRGAAPVPPEPLLR